MERFITGIVILFCSMLNSTTVVLIAQDLPTFQIIDNTSVGLTPTIYEKYGVAVADFDRNGFPDIHCIRWQNDGYSHIYANEKGVFQDITVNTPIEQIESNQDGKRTYTPLWVDYDNDGDKDLCFGTKKHFHLLQNNDNIFTDVAQQVALVGYKPGGFISEWDFMPGAWGDYDLDGDLDFVASQVNNPNLYLFRNDGTQFTNVASEAGLDGTPMAGSGSLTFEDIDLDGDLDLFSNIHFYFNEDGHFNDVTSQLGISPDINSSFREFFDYDNDGDLDFFKVNGSPSDNSTMQLWGNQDGVFTDVSEDAVLTIYNNPTRAISIGDFDNDGDQDIFVHNDLMLGFFDVLLLNEEIEPGVHVFTDVGGMVGFTFAGDRKGTAFFDYNMDGFLDLYTASAEKNHILYHNNGNENNWVGFILEGTQSNTDGIGCLVTLYTGDKRQIRTKKCGNFKQNQANPYIHFGIGAATEIDSVIIRWPLGIEQVITDIAINQYHPIKESDASAVNTGSDSEMPASFSLAQNYPNPFNPETRIDFSIGRKSYISLEIFNVLGNKMATIIDRVHDSGNYGIQWDGKDDTGADVPSGVYIYCLNADNQHLHKKMLLLR